MPATPRRKTQRDDRVGRLPGRPRHTTDPEDLVGLLHARGQRATPQRLVILRELRHRGHHATADEIGRAVRAQLPGTSIPTVYATLELLVELGLARRIDVGASATLYDARTQPHQHTACRRCGRVQDLDWELPTEGLVRAAHESGFQASSVELVISGLCADCARTAAEQDLLRG